MLKKTTKSTLLLQS